MYKKDCEHQKVKPSEEREGVVETAIISGTMSVMDEYKKMEEATHAGRGRRNNYTTTQRDFVGEENEKKSNEQDERPDTTASRSVAQKILGAMGLEECLGRGGRGGKGGGRSSVV